MIAAILLAAATLGPPTAFDAVVAALASGQRPAARAKAAQILTDTGARPLDDGGDDVASLWTRRSAGRAYGATPASYRDRALGPGYRRVIVASGTVARFGQVFLAGQRARVALVPISAANVRLSVTDDDGTAQCRSTTASRCDWVPLWTTRFQIEVRNPGPATADYYLVVE